MLIDYQHKLLFVHVPKAAGTSIRSHIAQQSRMKTSFWGRFAAYRQLLPMGDLAHIPIRLATEFVSQKIVDTFFKFAVIRNPYDRVYSAYLHLTKPAKRTGINNFVARIARMSCPHVLPQADFVCDTGGCLGVNELIRYETLIAELNPMLARFGMTPCQCWSKKSNRSRDSGFLDEFSEESICAVERIYDRDFSLFGYPKRSTI